MRNSRTLGPWLRQFLTDHIVTERCLARNTQLSYRDSFTLLLPYLSKKAHKPVDRLDVEDIAPSYVLQFLAHLEKDRGCSVQTRNQRLAAIRSFARFVASRDPTHVAWCGQIRAISTKKAAQQPISWMTRKEVEALVAVPDCQTPRGQTEHSLLLFLYNTGARVSEATRLQVGNLQLGWHEGHALATLCGKGNKIRQCPLWPRTEKTLSKLVQGRKSSDPVFLSRHHKQYTRYGVYRLVERCAEQIPSLVSKKITPHVIRHTSACHLLQAGVDLNTIRAWLGHVSLDTTNIYAEIDLQMKAEAMELCGASSCHGERPWKTDKGVIAFLKTI
jgi:site-specific recombinase XerD